MPAAPVSASHASDRESRHQQRMSRKKAVIDAKIAAAPNERGLLLINTGNGKGKSTAAFGVLARALGHGIRAAVIQFVKGRCDTGEEAFFQRIAPTIPGALDWHVSGQGFTWETQDGARDAAAGREAWAIACGHLADPAIGLVVLDEFTYALKYGWIDGAAVLAALAARPPMQHVIITGRGAPEALVDAADTVTEMTLVKHAFKSGVKAMAGLEW
jgi:cob(I)alamin adenosyltransferase